MGLFNQNLCPTYLDLSFFDYAGASMTQHGRKDNDSNFLRTNSELPLLPDFDGHMGTHGKNKVFFFLFGQRPRRGQSPVEHRGTFVLPFVCLFICSFVPPPPSGPSGLKSGL